ncbi:MAG: tetratricopeptide repeat protein [Candidatus Muiribacteriaceae bacterium]
MKKSNLILIFLLAGFVFFVKKRFLESRLRRLRASGKLKKYIDIVARSEDELELAAAYYTIGNIYLFDFQDSKSASDYYRKVIDSDSDNYLEDSALFNLGLCYRESSAQKAEKIFRRLIEEYPESARAKDAEIELSRI